MPSYGLEVNNKFFEVCDTLGVTQIVTEPTRESNILDLLLVTSPNRYSDVEIVPGISDHDAVCVTYLERVNRNRKKPRHIYIYSKADMQSLKNDIKHYAENEFKEHCESLDMNETWEQFKETLQTMMNKYIPQRMMRQNCKLPWINTKIRRLIRRRKRARAKAKKTKVKANWDRYITLDKQLKTELREAQTQYLTEMFSGDTNRLNKKTWSYIKSRRRDNVGIPPLRNVNGRLCEEAHEKAEIMANQYNSVFTKDNPHVPTPGILYCLPRMPEITIDVNGVMKLLQELKVNKAPGPDLIPNRVLKECYIELSPILTGLYRKSLKDGHLPRDWLSANVIGIFKKGNKQDASNYRPISLTCVTCKILEHILYSQIMKHYSRHNFISNTQHGFQKGLSCETQLATTVEELQKGLDNKYQQDVVILDFNKAFDKVPHRHLLKKLDASGIRGNTHKWLTAYLTNRTQRVIVDGRSSGEAPVVSGVPQGTVLGPLMFLTYIIDITSDLTSQMKLFADDALLFRPIKSEKDCKSLQKDLDTLEIWSKRWKMTFNISKCHVLRMTGKKASITQNYKLGNDPLTTVTSHPYLGVEFDSKLSWKGQVQNVKAKGTKTLNMVRRNFTKGTNANIREQIYTSLVRPTLEYGSVAWDPHQANRIQMLESVQNKGARYVTQEWSRYSSITDIKDKLGWCTLQQRRYVNRLSFFFKSVNNLHGHSLPPHVTRQKRASKNHHAYSYHTLRARTDAYLHSFLPRAIRAWNNLPQEIVLAPSPESFRAQLANKLRSNQITLATSSMTTAPRTGIPIHTF